jgi:hypothetical protein
MTLLENMLAAAGRREAGCDHDGHHSGQGRYVRDRGEMRYVTVCDACGAETGEVLREKYVPQFDPCGNDPYVASASAA